MVCVKVRERERRRALEVFVKALIGCILMEDIASVGTGCEGIRADLASGVGVSQLHRAQRLSVIIFG
ncbi:uncharacterized protein [Physcomitrium patens]|uniref:uncharacterized protein isoform X14 n=1 Tax=Physcomitrium patens TaxID=3218 RepID=UPI003CCE3853